MEKHEYNKLQYVKNKEQILARQKVKRDQNKELYRKRAKATYDKHRSKFRIDKRPKTGERHGLLTAVSHTGHTSSGNSKWLWKCDCGRERTFTAWDVRAGRYHSCGCVPPTRKQRAYLYVEKFKISKFDADLLAIRVEGRCEVCNEFESRIHPQTGLPQWLSIDHCHETGLIRGVLCVKCNSAEGYLRGLENAKKMVTYLEKFQKRKCI
jgi:hypothetical protein